MIRLAALTATAVLVFTLLTTTNAIARHDEEPDPCAGLSGAPRGLCNAHVHAMQCGEASPRADETACNSVAENYEEMAGFPLPTMCLCDFSLERAIADGWNLLDNYSCFVDSTGIVDISMLTTGECPSPPCFDVFVPPFVQAGISTAGEFRCEYSPDILSAEIVTGTFPDQNTIYEACKGAILTLKANTLGTVIGNCP